MGFLAQLEAADLDSAARLLLLRWQYNRRFFEKHQSELARFFQTPNQRYELHLSPTGINLRDKTANTLLYEVQGGRSTLFETARDLAFDPPRNRLWRLIGIQNSLERETETGFEITARGVNALVDLFERDPDYRAGQVHFDGTRQLPPVVCYGLLSGLHLALLEENDLLKNGLLIYEPEPELFVLSAYFVDYEKLMSPGRGTHLIVGGHPQTDRLKRFFAEDLIVRGFIRMELSVYDHPAFADAKTRVEEAARGVLRGWGTAEDELYGLNNKLVNVNPSQPAYPMLTQPQKIQTPIAVVGNGPSLDALLPFLKTHREKLVIFSAGTALKPLRSAGIVPDFQIEIERRDHVAGVLKAAPLSDIPLIAADLIHPSTLAATKESYLFIRDSTAGESLWQPAKVVRFSNPMVGNAALALALEFTDTVYLCGLDAGFRKDQKHHASHSHYDALKDTGGEQLPARGNFSPNVWSNSLFSLSRSVLQKAIAAQAQARVFNLSDGAFVVGATPLRPEQAMIEARGNPAEAVGQIKNSFSKKGVFFDAKADLNTEFARAVSDLAAILKAFEPKNKIELFKAVSAAYRASLLVRQERPAAGLLLGGTLWHLFNALFKGLLQVQRSDISILYAEGVRQIKETLIKIRLSSGEPTTSPPEKQPPQIQSSPA